MIFSKITLQEKIEHKTLSAIANQDEYKLHQILWRFLPQITKQPNQRSFIYRCDFQKCLPCFYMVSQEKPCDEENIWRIEKKPYAPKIKLAQNFSFMLRVNPRIAKLTQDPHKKHVYCDAIMDAYKKQNSQSISKQQLIQEVGSNWLYARAAKHGFSIQSLIVEAYQQHCLYKKQHGAIRFSTVDYRGKLRVDEPELFLSALYRGIGAAKGFGCGLLMIKA